MRGILLTLLASMALAGDKPEIRVEERVLPNGMKWLLYENHQSPTVTLGWVAHVGSVNEREGITGISHLFEHMMFKGTHTIGTKNITLDLQTIEAQEKVQDEMRAEMALMRDKLRRGEIRDLQSPESQTPRYRELRQRFDALVKTERQTIVKDELDEIYTRNGGEGLNAETTEDFTLYFVRLPKNRIELWAWLESDRLVNRVFREFYSERDVVYEERRRSVESTPLGKYDEAFNAVFWQAHPYKWPVLGWPSDVSSISKAQADAYYDRYYAPNNVTAVLAGDFETREVWPILTRYFGRIPKGKTPPPEVVTLEPAQLGEKRFNATAETSPTVRMWWHAVPFVHKDRAALELLADLLSGRTGRLFKELVISKKIANEARADLDSKKYAGIFEVEVTAKEGALPTAVEGAINEEVERLKTVPAPLEELQKVKNEAKANAFRRLTSVYSIALQLLFYDGLGDWGYINTSSTAMDGVTPEDIQRVASAYLGKENRTVGVFLRGAPVADADIPEFPPEIRTRVVDSLARLAQETNVEKVQDVIEHLKEGIKEAGTNEPPPVKAALEFLLRKTEERLAVLKKGGK